MDIALVTGPYYPHMSPESNCIDKFIQELKKRHQVRVICPSSIPGEPNVELQGLNVYYISDFWNDLRGLCNRRIIDEKGFFWKLVLFFVRLHGLIISPFVYPSRNSWKIEKYKRRLMQLNDLKKIDAIISVAGLPCAHLGALRYKEEHPETKWITYTFDPFSASPDTYNSLFFRDKRKRKNRAVEKRIYENADYNIFTPELYVVNKDLFNLTSPKIRCFPYVLSPFPSQKKNEKRCDESQLKAIYAGALNKKVRNPQRMLEIMKEVDCLEVDLYVAGNCKKLIKRFECEHIKANSLLPRTDYLYMINNEADILINVGNSTALMTPSKFLELLSTGLPLINFYVIEDTTFYMTEKYPLGLNIGPKVENANHMIEDFCKMTKGKRLSFEEVADLFPANLIHNQLNELEDMLEN